MTQQLTATPAIPSKISSTLLNIATGTATLGLLVGAAFGKRAYDHAENARIQTGRDDPAVILPTRVEPSDKFPYDVMIESKKGDQEYRGPALYAPNKNISCVVFDPVHFAEQLATFYRDYPDLMLSSLVAISEIELRYWVKPRNKYVEFTVYQAQHQTFPSLEAYNSSLAPDWFDRMRGIGFCRCAPKIAIAKIANEFELTFPVDSEEHVSDYFPTTLEDQRMLPKANWFVVTKRVK